MQAIRTSYCGATNIRGARVHACCDGGSAYVPYQSDLDTEECHRAACDALRKKLGWSKPTVWVGGCFKGEDWYWVPVTAGYAEYLKVSEEA